jgi:rhamnosyltransferase subunit B
LNVFLVPVGSHGDVHPFCGIGAELARRGHAVTVFANAHFEPLVRRLGLEFVAVGTDREFREIMRDPELWHPTRGWRKVFEGTVNQILPLQYEALKAHLVPGRTVVVAATLALGARVLQDETGVPTATLHLQPSVMRSVHATPKLPGAPIPRWSPRWMKRLMFWAADRLVIDPVVGPPLNAFRATRGLPPVDKVTSDWWHSPDLVIGLFPEWFAAPQPDWPPQMRLTGFPLFDERGLAPLPAELVRFLDAGGPPVAFTPGSAMAHGRPFFDAAAEACARLGRRGLLLTRHTDHLPPRLPAGVIHVPYAPFSELLPRCAAIVHHGGVGTTAQAFAAGVPQLVMPMSHDQPDNADRVRRLGTGDEIPVRAFRGAAVAKKLRRLIESRDVAARCREIAGRFAGEKPLERTCDLIEKLAARGATSAAKAPAQASTG